MGLAFQVAVERIAFFEAGGKNIVVGINHGGAEMKVPVRLSVKQIGIADQQKDAANFSHDTMNCHKQ